MSCAHLITNLQYLFRALWPHGLPQTNATERPHVTQHLGITVPRQASLFASSHEQGHGPLSNRNIVSLHYSHAQSPGTCRIPRASRLLVSSGSHSHRPDPPDSAGSRSAYSQWTESVYLATRYLGMYLGSDSSLVVAISRSLTSWRNVYHPWIKISCLIVTSPLCWHGRQLTHAQYQHRITRRIHLDAINTSAYIQERPKV
jgi:hypothetical protein